MNRRANERREAISTLREEVERSGWTVSEEPTNDGVAISVNHDLSTRRTLILRDADRSAPGVTVSKFLKRYEIELVGVGRAPKDMPHRALIGAIRSAAFVGQWSVGVLVALARLLGNHGVLTEAESAWLEEAGVPWSSVRSEQEQG